MREAGRLFKHMQTNTIQAKKHESTNTDRRVKREALQAMGFENDWLKGGRADRRCTCRLWLAYADILIQKVSRQVSVAIAGICNLTARKLPSVVVNCFLPSIYRLSWCADITPPDKILPLLGLTWLPTQKSKSHRRSDLYMWRTYWWYCHPIVLTRPYVDFLSYHTCIITLARSITIKVL